ncbi:cytoplasmic protein NCK2-like isoform X1 [Lampetra planeri]
MGDLQGAEPSPRAFATVADEMAEEVSLVAKYDYIAQQEQELNIKKNERLWLLDDSKSWWQVRNAQNQTGFVPSNYVERKNSLKKASFVKNMLGIGKVKRKPSNCEGGAAASPSSTLDSGPDGSPTETTRALSLPAIVKFNYAAERDDELSLIKGARVTVQEKCNDGWWRGACDGREGWFPSNYVVEEVVEGGGGGGGGGMGRLDAGAASPRLGTALAAALSATNGNRGGACVSPACPQVLHVVHAMYPFSSGSDEELGFNKGEVMDVLEKPEDDPEWWRCRKSDGRVGLVPRNYVQVVPDSPSQRAHSAAVLAGCLGPASSGQFAGRPWYYGHVTRQQAEDALNERGVDGDFLVRNSESSPTDFSVSLKATGKNKHFKVQQNGNDFCIGQRRFSSMADLIEHYKRAPIFTSSQGDKLYLIRPLP